MAASALSALGDIDNLNEKENTKIVNENIKNIILLPQGNIPQFDRVLCDKNYEENSYETYNGIQCKNYRGVDINGTQHYLLVGSINLDTQPEITYYQRFLTTKCNQKDPVIIDFHKRGLLSDPRKIVYFKGAYTIFPNVFTTEIKSEEDKQKFKQQLEIYVKATRSILVHILPYLKKIGITTIVVDPEPGFHPSTIGWTEERKLAGLIGLYTGMGLKEIKCLYTTSALIAFDFDVLDNPHLSPQQIDTKIREQLVKKRGYVYDYPIMIGSIDDMLTNYNIGTSVIGRALSFIPIAGQDVRDLQEFLRVPIKFNATVGSLNNLLTVRKMDAVFNPSPDIRHAYRQKYLKYKQKYLELKKTLP